MSFNRTRRGPRPPCNTRLSSRNDDCARRLTSDETVSSQRGSTSDGISRTASTTTLVGKCGIRTTLDVGNVAPAACASLSGTGPQCSMNGERADVGRGVASTSLSVGQPIDESWKAGAAGDAGREARGGTESFILARFSKDLKEKSHKSHWKHKF